MKCQKLECKNNTAGVCTLPKEKMEIDGAGICAKFIPVYQDHLAVMENDLVGNVARAVNTFKHTSGRSLEELFIAVEFTINRDLQFPSESIIRKVKIEPKVLI